MTTYVLIVILNIGTYQRADNSAITMQEFKTRQQCEYAAQLIKASANRVAALHCINK